MRSLASLCAAAALLVCVFAGCSPNGGVRSEPAGRPYTVGVLVARSGPAAEADRVVVRTAEFFEKLVNSRGGIDGRPIRILLEDTAGTPQGAAVAVRRLAARPAVSAVVGPTRRDEALAARDAAETAAVPLLSCAGGRAFVTGAERWTFSLAPSETAAARRLADHLAGLKPPAGRQVLEVALFADADDRESRAFAMLQSLLADAANLRVVVAGRLSPGETTPGRLTALREASPDQVVYWGSSAATAQFVRALRAAGVETPVVGGPDLVTGGFAGEIGHLGEGVVAVTENLRVGGLIGSGNPQMLAWTEYSKQYEAEYGQPPDLIGGRVWDAFQQLIRAFAYSGDERAAVRDHIERTASVGTAGSFRFSPLDHGNVEDSFSTARLAEGRWQPL